LTTCEADTVLATMAEVVNAGSDDIVAGGGVTRNGSDRRGRVGSIFSLEDPDWAAIA
jgi:hypothetical protein